jgi:hypothetical protein
LMLSERNNKVDNVRMLYLLLCNYRVCDLLWQRRLMICVGMR